MAFVAFTTEQVNADSPINETLMTQMKDNFDDLNSARVTNGDTHDHDGGDGAVIPQGGIDSAAVGQGELKTASGAVSTTSTVGVNLTLPGGAYGFYPQTKETGNGMTANMVLPDFQPGSTYVTNIGLKINSTGTAFAQQRYIQSSPPYKIGDKEWGHFLYALVSSTGDIIAAYEAEDPPYAYNGPPQHEKDSIERIAAVPHPFADYWQKAPADDGLEIVLFDLREKDTKKWRGDMSKQGKGILEDLAGNVNPAGILLPPQSLGLPDIPGFTDKVKIRG